MEKRIQNLFNFVHDNFGKDDSVIGLCGLKKQTEFDYLYLLYANSNLI